MSDYDSVIGNIYQPNEFIFPHKDVTESKSAEGYPVIVYTMGANAGLGIVDNNKGKMTFANQYDSRFLRGNEKLKGYTNEVLTKNGTIYTFGLEGKGRFQLTHSTPINDAKVGSQLPITLPNGNIITNYTITLTFRRAADLEPGMPTAPAILSKEEAAIKPTQPSTTTPSANPAEVVSQSPTETFITYTPKGKTEQVYVVRGSKVFNKDGKEVFKENGVDRNKIFANVAVKQKRGVVVEYDGAKYVVNNKEQILSGTTGKIMAWNENNGNRIAILKLANDKFAMNNPEGLPSIDRTAEDCSS